MKNSAQMLKEIRDFLEKRALDQSVEIIESNSPYSNQINKFISSLNELNIYIELGLQEAKYERPCLIWSVDYQYIDPESGLSNFEKMVHGFPPIDPATKSVIHLHHIGQRFDSPFAELPRIVHQAPSNEAYLHKNSAPSWRRDSLNEAKFQQQKSSHWKMRSKEFDAQKK